MRVLHVCEKFFPQRGGGETYTGAVVQALSSLNVVSTIAVGGLPLAKYSWNGLHVQRIGEPWSVDSPASVSFALSLKAVVEKVRPDILHFHFLPPDAAPLIRALRARRIPCVYTFHHPKAFCGRRDLLYMGKRLCDAPVNSGLCTPCRYQQMGVPAVLAQAGYRVAMAMSPKIALRLPRRIRTAVDLPRVVSAQIEAAREALAEMDRIFALSEMSIHALDNAGVAIERVILCRLGTHHTFSPSARQDEQAPHDGKLRGVYVGSIDSTKGASLICKALQNLRAPHLEVDFFGHGIEPDELHRFYENTDVRPRVRFRGVLPDDQVVAVMAKASFVFVPSMTFETGPFTVIEALQAGVPVMGSDIAGINEWIENDVNGCLVPLGSVRAWRAAIQAIVSNPMMLQRWRSQVRIKRSMQDVAKEVLDTYLSAIQRVAKQQSNYS